MYLQVKKFKVNTFIHAPLPGKTLPQALIITPQTKENYSFPLGSIFLKIYSPCRKLNVIKTIVNGYKLNVLRTVSLIFSEIIRIVILKVAVISQPNCENPKEGVMKNRYMDIILVSFANLQFLIASPFFWSNKKVFWT